MFHDFFHIFWIVDDYSGALTTYTLDRLPLEFDGKMYDSFEMLEELLPVPYTNSWLCGMMFSDGGMFACVWQVLMMWQLELRKLDARRKFPDRFTPVLWVEAITHYY